MLYRENGQFKTTYRADQQILPIRQDRVVMALLLVFAFAVVPMLASDYFFRAILIPFLIMSLAALGVNILVGYCGQISLGSGAFMAVGAYGAYNFFARIPGMPLIPTLILGGLCATVFGILFGLPSLRVRGLYLAVATLAAGRTAVLVRCTTRAVTSFCVLATPRAVSKLRPARCCPVRASSSR